MSDFARMTIHELAPLIERREVSPVEVTREALDRIDALDARLHAFITVRHEHALDAARAAEDEIHEWAMGGTCAKSAFGEVHNPWDESRVPGGSSGGSAAAVSASLIFGSVGTASRARRPRAAPPR